MRYFRLEIDVCIGRSIGRTLADTVLMVIEKNMAGGQSTITCGYVLMNIEDLNDRQTYIFIRLCNNSEASDADRELKIPALYQFGW